MERQERPTSGGGKNRWGWDPSTQWGTALALGICIGVAIGFAMGNVGFGIAIGIAIAIAFGGSAGAVSSRRARRDGADPGHDDRA